MRFPPGILPPPVNEPALCRPGTAKADALAAEIERQTRADVTVPLVIGGREVETGRLRDIRCPHDRDLRLGRFHQASAEHVAAAEKAAAEAARDWARTPWEDRAAVFLKAAELLATRFRAEILAATVLGQSKTADEAEADAVCELADFWRFNPFFLERILEERPLVHAPGTWNRCRFRALEGFVLAVTPFNFTAIGGNLPTAPALMGNTVLWKPASTAVLSARVVLRVLEHAGLPPGVINFLPGSGAEVGDPALDRPSFAGLHFTGSTRTFSRMWGRIGANVEKGRYRTFPRIVGETGGKDFVLAAPDADVEALADALFRGAYGYQGQKCSAASRAYVPLSLWPDVRSLLGERIGRAPVGDPAQPGTALGAVIDRPSFERIRGCIEQAQKDADAEVVIGGRCDGSRGYFVHPTVIETYNPRYRTMEEEIFGPVLTVLPFEDGRLDEAVRWVDQTSSFGLTGSIFARDRRTLRRLTGALEQAAGNLYVNDKPTGAVVGQQPFGGARMSGTNDKAGSALNLLRWTSMLCIKERFA